MTLPLRTNHGSVWTNMKMEIDYRISPSVTNRELNALFADAWPGPHVERDFQQVLVRSLGYICAYWNSELVGFANVAWDGDVHAFLLDPTVRSDLRRQGIGREMVRRAAQLSREARCEWLHVDYDPELTEFYCECGFRPAEAGLINLVHEEQ